jgi:uncharacterized protein with NRDE domain
MCLAVFAWNLHPEYRLILAANRDEFHQRPSQELHWWPDRPELLAGRDLQAGGTWLAVSRSGRFATVTNYREQKEKKAGLQSRGGLVTDFVAGTEGARQFLNTVNGDRYAGYSLLATDGNELCYASNRGDDPVSLSPGVYGLSNASLDTPWPKLTRSRNALKNLVESGSVDDTALHRILADRTTAPVPDVESGELPFAFARALTAPFIVAPEYGTRCSTVLLWSANGRISVSERRFDSGGTRSGDSRFRFPTENQAPL